MEPFDLQQYVSRSGALDLNGIRWDEVPRTPLSYEAIRCLQYMQDIETHTIIYVRTLLSTRAIDDPEVAVFLASWFYEETFHGRALDRFLEAAGHHAVERVRSRPSLAQRFEAKLTSCLARVWPEFVAVHMTWGAINELTTLSGYRRLMAVAAHPVLSDLLSRIIRDESRHFFFYYRQAEQRLRDPVTAARTRVLVRRFWAPVGSGVQAASETRFLAGYLFSGVDGREAAQKVDDTIRKLPGFDNLPLLEAWIDAQVTSADDGSAYASHHALRPYRDDTRALAGRMLSRARS